MRIYSLTLALLVITLCIPITSVNAVSEPATLAAWWSRIKDHWPRVVEMAEDLEIDRDRVQKIIDSALHQAEVVLQPAARIPTETAHGIVFLDDAATSPTDRVVLLVHGMDDIGVMWDELIPALRSEGHPIAVFRYPSTGAVAAAADLLAEQLGKARKSGVQRIDIVAHSMGGLVARDLLTRCAYYNGDAIGGDRYPTVDRLIMIGTPNQGAPLAKYRWAVGAGRQIYLACNGRELSTEDDGDGAAGVDLLPGSEFLRELNRRPHARNVKITIISGRWSPIEPERLEALLKSPAVSNAVDRTESSEPSNRERIAAAFSSAVNIVGDGCVTIESARLHAVDDVVIVRGNHLSILSNMGVAGDMPPAVPIVLDRLRAKAATIASPLPQ